MNKCKFCKYYTVSSIPDWVGLLEEDIPFCKIKEKRVNPEIIRPFCRNFKSKEKANGHDGKNL